LRTVKFVYLDMSSQNLLIWLRIFIFRSRSFAFSPVSSWFWLLFILIVISIVFYVSITFRTRFRNLILIVLFLLSSLWFASILVLFLFLLDVVFHGANFSLVLIIEFFFHFSYFFRHAFRHYHSLHFRAIRVTLKSILRLRVTFNPINVGLAFGRVSLKKYDTVGPVVVNS